MKATIKVVDVRLLSSDHAAYYKKREEKLARMRIYDQSPKKKAYNKTYKKRRDPIKDAARDAVRKALAKGVLVKEGCKVCGDAKVQGHHEDYTKSLEVVWLCRQHHSELHRVVVIGI